MDASLVTRHSGRAWRRVVDKVVTERRWPVALFVALLVVGPVVLPGAVFNLDLVLVPRLDIPSGFWGLGPELPRRLPLWVPISFVSALVPATLVGKSLLVGQMVLGWTGMARRFEAAGRLGAHTIGALYVLSPFMTTRSAVGHFMITVPLAALPWVLPTLARPGRRLGSTFLAASILSVGGHFGGSLALLVLVCALVIGSRERWLPAIAVTIAAQSAWLVPGIAVWLTTHREAASSVVFATVADGPADIARLAAGAGYWNTYFQIGATGTVGVAVGVALFALGVVGRRDLPAELRRLLEVLGGLGLVVAASSGLPVASDVFEGASSNPVLAVWRESHRLLGLYVLWVSPAAVFGARRLARAAMRREFRAGSGALSALPLGLLAVLALPAMWGYGGRVEASELPAGWNQARDIVRDEEEGTVLALPWRQYFNLQIGSDDVHRVLNPLPLFLGGDVISSSDNQLGGGARERGDPREPTVDGLVERLEQGENIGADLADVGVRWVVLLTTGHAPLYVTAYGDPELSLVLDTDDIDVFEVRRWVGSAERPDGAPASVDRIVPGFVAIDRQATVWNAPAGSGWLRGWKTTAENDNGTVLLEPGDSLVWNMATAPSLIAQLGWAAAIALVVIRRRSPRHDDLPGPCTER